MATTSSSEEGTAPKEFQLSSSQDSGSKYSSNRKKCPLCSSYRKKFYCKECIHIGDFGNLDSYAGKQMRFLRLAEERRDIQEKCKEQIDKSYRLDLLVSGIRQSRNNIHLLKLALEEKRARQKANIKLLHQLTTNNDKLHKLIPMYMDLVDKDEIYADGQHKRNTEARAKLHEKHEEVKKLTKLRIKELMRYIFPITKIQPRNSAVESSENEVVNALAEASHTTYIRDRWIYTDNSAELQLSIVAPTLPCSGNYSDYSIWVTQNKDGVPGGGSTSTTIKSNPAYSISAALTYTAQLLNVIAYYLDVRIPYKMIYSDFCSKTMNEQQFSRRVARLNANVLHLCFTQNTDLTALQPAETLHNILQLVNGDNRDLGRRGPMEVDVNVSASLEDQLAGDLQPSEDSDSEEGDALPNEWEAVPHVQCPEASAGPMTQPHHQQQSTAAQNMSSQQVNSMAGGLMNSAAASIASMWRGWTGR